MSESQDLGEYFASIREKQGISRKDVAEYLAVVLEKKPGTLLHYVHHFEENVGDFLRQNYGRGKTQTKAPFLHAYAAALNLSQEDREQAVGLLTNLRNTYGDRYRHIQHGLISVLRGEPDAPPVAPFPSERLASANLAKRSRDLARKWKHLPPEERLALEQRVNELYQKNTTSRS